MWTISNVSPCIVTYNVLAESWHCDFYDDEDEDNSCPFVANQKRYLGDHQKMCSFNPNRVEIKCPKCPYTAFLQKMVNQHMAKKHNVSLTDFVSLIIGNVSTWYVSYV